MAKTVGKKKPFKATPATKRRSRGDTVKQIALGTELKPRQVKEVFEALAALIAADLPVVSFQESKSALEEVYLSQISRGD